MKTTISLEQIPKTGGLNSNSILRQYILDLMATFMKNNFIYTKQTQKQTAKAYCYS